MKMDGKYLLVTAISELHYCRFIDCILMRWQIVSSSEFFYNNERFVYFFQQAEPNRPFYSSFDIHSTSVVYAQQTYCRFNGN